MDRIIALTKENVIINVVIKLQRITNSVVLHGEIQFSWNERFKLCPRVHLDVRVYVGE